MPLAIILSRAVSGIYAPLVTVEVHLSNGLAGFHIVGLPATAVKESRDRVRSALLNSKFEFPIKYITVNLAPADLPKEGGRFDLAIALGILVASKQLPGESLVSYEFTGELALSGELRSVKGILPMAFAAYKAQRTLICPMENANEANLIPQATILPATHLLEICQHFSNVNSLSPNLSQPFVPTSSSIDLSDVKGQAQAKRVLEIAAAGGHSLLLVGPPGTGKTMLASRLATILPDLNEEEALEVAMIASISQQGFEANNWGKIPFRSPHHTASYAALVGGGRPPKPGEISLSHKGVLFLDELPEFKRAVLECLREPLEAGEVTISRAAWQSIFPAQFQLIAAMNPCPCGYAGSVSEECICSGDQIRRYRLKLSGPFLDRIDLQFAVNQISQANLLQLDETIEKSEQIKKRVVIARNFQAKRDQSICNARLPVSDLEKITIMDQSTQGLLLQAAEKFKLSSRSVHRLLKVARTIADLSLSDLILSTHIAEALQYRCLDKPIGN